MDLKSKLRFLSPQTYITKMMEKRNIQEDVIQRNSRMERKKQIKESKLDQALYRTSIYAFFSICIMLSLIPIAYFLPWQQIVQNLMYLLLASLFLSFTLSSIAIKKRSNYIKLSYMWGVWIFSLLLLLFYLFIFIYFRFLLH